MDRSQPATIPASMERKASNASMDRSQPATIPASMERKASNASIAESSTENDMGKGLISMSSRSSSSSHEDATRSKDPSQVPATHKLADLEDIVLPPLPSDIPDDYGSADRLSSSTHSKSDGAAAMTRKSMSAVPSVQDPRRSSTSTLPDPPNSVTMASPKKPRREAAPLTEQETRVAVELLFAVITELYTLSSAWNIRRTLLTAAKTFLLRPGNPSLASIQSLIQDSVIASNTSDASVASHLLKLRVNAMPTEEELKTWPAEISVEDKEKLRVKARKLLVERGIPAALTGVMGQAATGEAMGKVFDCLQIEEIARGLVFGLLLQGVRAMAH